MWLVTGGRLGEAVVVGRFEGWGLGGNSSSSSSSRASKASICSRKDCLTEDVALRAKRT